MDVLAVRKAVGKGLRKAREEDRPTLIEVRTDPDVPPLPPHITLKEAKGFLSAVVKGDTGLLNTISHAAHEAMQKVLPQKT